MQLRNLRIENDNLHEQVQGLNQQIQASATEAGLGDEIPEDGDELSSEAVRKRLARLCAKKHDGNLGQ